MPKFDAMTKGMLTEVGIVNAESGAAEVEANNFF